MSALVQACASGTVVIFGPAGSGKTTALEHLAAVLPADGRCVFVDESLSLSEPEVIPSNGLRIVAGAPNIKVGPVLATYALRTWTRDDVIEYLLATHRQRCASVVARLTAEELGQIGGLPHLCRIVCDEMAADETIQTVADALRRHMTTLMADKRLAESARDASLAAISSTNPMLLRQAALPDNVYRVLRHRPVQLLLAAEGLAAALRSNAKPRFLSCRLPRELVRQTAHSAQDDGRLLDRLRRLLTGSREHQPMAASILHYAGALPGALCRKANLQGAYLDGVVWPKAWLVRADLSKSDLSGADLRGADLAKATLDDACLVGAQLTGAMLVQVSAHRADLSHADLSSAKAEVALFDAAKMNHTRMDRADLRCASFRGAGLEYASFAHADLSRAIFKHAQLAGTDFGDAKLVGAKMVRLQLCDSQLSGAAFTDADLTECNLDGVELAGVDFTRADLRGASLSGSIMRGVDFTSADLRETRLAEIDWEGACLRNADLRGATFHMGGSRSGLVGSPIASEGSRTGFYTDDFEEQHFKSPEEIRKANLCGADLRGAIIKGVDFYLVDLRGAQYDPDQEQQLRRSGAILQARV
jgi:uncharacterized protein YjbI with pentapeptide repeats/energy-coupling factor transporter ATP-binding protein EcfA2